MAATVRLYAYAVVDIDGIAFPLGSLDQPAGIALGDDLPYKMIFEVAPTTAVKLFDVAENLADFDFCWIQSDLDVLIQFVTHSGAVYDQKGLLGSGTQNTYGAPMLLNTDDIDRQDGTVATFDGTPDTIEQIWAYNEDSTDTARVLIFAAT